MKSLRTRLIKTQASLHKVKQTLLNRKPIQELNLTSFNRMPVQFSIIVPSTYAGKDMSPIEFKQRVDEEKDWIVKAFGGDTAIPEEGDYYNTDVNHIETEKGVMVQVSTSRDKYNEMKLALEKHIMDRKDDWKQQSIAYSLEGNLYIYPKQDGLPHDTAKNIEVR